MSSRARNRHAYARVRRRVNNSKTARVALAGATAALIQCNSTKKVCAHLAPASALTRGSGNAVPAYGARARNSRHRGPARATRLVLVSPVWYGMVEVCEDAPVAVSGVQCRPRLDRHQDTPSATQYVFAYGASSGHACALLCSFCFAKHPRTHPRVRLNYSRMDM